ncbi:Emopamil-binding protein-like [Geodia barretti]|uniref:Emopamil-binding protein-like n=1 Tax=Geodia barretti TaxID=519541 RepID=A0AA35X7I4_GEOBA|nr:Emopamil-binding protein-like [Geodia barretti]
MASTFERFDWFSLAATAVASVGVGGVALLLGLLLLRSKRRQLSLWDKLAVFWLLYNAIVHWSIEGSFVFLSLTGSVNTAEGLMADLWKEYAKADARWGVSDPTIVSLEILTVFFNGTLTLVLVHAVLAGRSYRHFVQVLVNTCELYGGWMTFAPEWLTGSKNLDTSSPLYLWVYLVFFNGLWVVAPVLLLAQSCLAISSHAKRNYRGKKE